MAKESWETIYAERGMTNTKSRGSYYSKANTVLLAMRRAAQEDPEVARLIETHLRVTDMVKVCMNIADANPYRYRGANMGSDSKGYYHRGAWTSKGYENNMRELLTEEIRYREQTERKVY